MATEPQSRPYRPTAPALVGRISDDGCRYIDAVATQLQPAAQPRGLKTYLAYHVAWAEDQGLALIDKVVFAPQHVAASIAAQKELGSPFTAAVRKTAAHLLPRMRTTHRQVLADSGRQPPYSAAEQADLWAIAAGLPERDQTSYRNGLAFALSFGIMGPASASIRPEHVSEQHGYVLLQRPDTGQLLMSGSPSARQLLTAGDGRSNELTEMWGQAGRQRLQAALTRATGRPELSPHRLRTTWVCELLAAGLPIDVVAAVTGLAPWTLAQYFPFLPTPTLAEQRRWLSGNHIARPSASPTLFAGISSPAAPLQGPTVPATHFDVERFAPRDPRVAAAWATGLAGEIGALVDGRHDARHLVSAFSSLLAWACTRDDVPSTIAALLRTSTIERFTAASPARSKATVRSRLRTLAELAGATRSGSGPSAKADEAQPYSHAELAAFASGRQQLSSSDGQLLDAYVGLGLGAGARGPEVLCVRGPDILRVDGGAVVVHLGEDRRPVPVADGHVEEVMTLAACAANGLLCGTTNADPWRQRTRIAQVCGITISATRFRATWVLSHLTRGVPLHLVATAAGAKLAGINALAAELPARPQSELLAWTAGAYVAAHGA